MKFSLAFCILAVFLVLAELTNAVKICEPRSVFNEDCNICRCNLDGTDKACTRKLCVHTPGPEGRPKRETQMCTPGTVFKIQCNDCVCTEAGVPVCTLKACID